MPVSLPRPPGMLTCNIVRGACEPSWRGNVPASQGKMTATTGSAIPTSVLLRPLRRVCQCEGFLSGRTSDSARHRSVPDLLTGYSRAWADQVLSIVLDTHPHSSSSHVKRTTVLQPSSIDSCNPELGDAIRAARGNLQLLTHAAGI